MVGALMNWQEVKPRQNKSHFLELNLFQSPGYSASFHEARLPMCRDRLYDRCFYSENGQWAEGRFISYAAIAGPTSFAGAEWMHIRIPISEVVTSLGWVSRPKLWSSAVFNGVYVGIELQGAIRSTVAIRNYEVYSEQ